ncbi:SPOR domain-containing protein [Paracoccaceae bacterium Fryx2]|nr:SPOR domain-containing protein [Paracoccaceae bacterium Fryx2]
MADVDFDDFEGSYAAPPGPRAAQMQRMVNLAGAVLSVVLVLGLAVWGYKLAVRDVTGVPVVRALEGPMRVAPKEPGGNVAAHQGLSVNAVAAVGAASPPAETMVLAPRPVELSLDDAPGLAATAPEAPQVLVTAQPAPEPVTAAAAPAEAGADPVALADQIAAGVAPLTDVPEVGDVEVPTDAGGGMARSPLPKARPALTQVAAAAPVAVAVTEIDPATLKSGTRLVQLGAFDDAEGARREWDRLAGQFGELMTGKARVVQSAQSGGRTFFRLRAEGFAGEDDARRFCSALLSENAACIPVSVR